MVSLLEKITEFGFGTFIMCVAVGVLISISVAKTGKEFLSVFGLKSERALREQSVDTRITTLESRMNEMNDIVRESKQELYDKQQEYHEQSVAIRNNLNDKQNALSDSIKELKLMFVNKNINDMRWEILDFANAIMSGNREYNKEQYDHVLEIYKEYERVLEENHMENGRISISMDFIMNHYSALMETGFKQ